MASCATCNKAAGACRPTPCVAPPLPDDAGSGDDDGDDGTTASALPPSAAADIPPEETMAVVELLNPGSAEPVSHGA
jgi:hypothetical protein